MTGVGIVRGIVQQKGGVGQSEVAQVSPFPAPGLLYVSNAFITARSTSP